MSEDGTRKAPPLPPAPRLPPPTRAGDSSPVTSHRPPLQQYQTSPQLTRGGVLKPLPPSPELRPLSPPPMSPTSPSSPSIQPSRPLLPPRHEDYKKEDSKTSLNNSESSEPQLEIISPTQSSRTQSRPKSPKSPKSPRRSQAAKAEDENIIITKKKAVGYGILSLIVLLALVVVTAYVTCVLAMKHITTAMEVGTPIQIDSAGKNNSENQLVGSGSGKGSDSSDSGSDKGSESSDSGTDSGSGDGGIIVPIVSSTANNNGGGGQIPPSSTGNGVITPPYIPSSTTQPLPDPNTPLSTTQPQPQPQPISSTAQQQQPQPRSSSSSTALPAPRSSSSSTASRLSSSSSTGTYIAPSSTATVVTGGKKKIVAYYTNWAQYRACNAYKYLPESLSTIASKIDYIHYAFAKIDNTGTWSPIEWNDCVTGKWANCQAYGTSMYDRIKAVRDAQNPNMKIIISVGGWSWGGVNTCPFFSSMASTAANRANFISSGLNFVTTFGFDGIDIDWEYPGDTSRDCNPADTMNFYYLVRDLRAAINAQRPATMITIAGPASPANILNMGLQNVHQYLDYVAIMSYDYHGAFDGKTGHNAPMYDSAGIGFSVTDSINNYMAAGVPANKLVVGMATYGRSFATTSCSVGVTTDTIGGAAQQCTGTQGTVSYYEVLNNVLTSPTAQRKWDDFAKVPYVCNPSTGLWVTYDDVESLSYKSAAIKSYNLFGAMFWALDFDDFPNGYPLITAVYNQLA